MLSRPTIRALARSLTLVPAALLLHIGAAVASELPEIPKESHAQRSAARMRPTGDAQEQARQLLLGIMSAPSATAQPAERAVRPTVGAQEQARQLLLGITTQTPGQPQSDVSKAIGNRGRGDAQVLAREVLLGQRDVPAAGP
jgi:hypothetical protein